MNKAEQQRRLDIADLRLRDHLQAQRGESGMCDWCGEDFEDGDETRQIDGFVVCRNCYLEGYVREQV